MDVKPEEWHFFWSYLNPLLGIFINTPEPAVYRNIISNIFNTLESLYDQLRINPRDKLALGIGPPVIKLLIFWLPTHMFFQQRIVIGSGLHEISQHQLKTNKKAEPLLHNGKKKVSPSDFSNYRYNSLDGRTRDIIQITANWAMLVWNYGITDDAFKILFCLVA